MPGLAAFIALTFAATIQHQVMPTRIKPMTVERARQDKPPLDSIAVGDDETLEARADRQARLTVPVHIEGHGPFRFLIDTGSQRTVLSSALAGRLGLASGPVMRVVGIVQAAHVPSAKVEMLDLGQLSIADMQVPLLEAANMGADGIIGTDTLQDQRVLLDFDREQIRLGNSQALGGNRGYEIVVRARRQSGQLIMTNAKIDGISVAVVIDTGAETSVGNRALQAAMGRRGSHSTPVMMESVTGHSVLAEIGLAKELTLSEIAISNPVIAFTDTPAFRELGLDRKPAMFLGMREMRVFRRVAIDFATRRVLFDLPAAL